MTHDAWPGMKPPEERPPGGEPPEFARLVADHYPELREIADRALRAEQAAAGRPPAAMDPTSLITETVIRLLHQRELPREGAHLRGLASMFMTRVIADRRRAMLAKGRDARRTGPLDTQAEGIAADDAPEPEEREGLVLLERAMVELAAEHPREMEVVTLSAVAGIPMERIAELLSVSGATAYRLLDRGRLLLAQRLKAMRERG